MLYTKVDAECDKVVMVFSRTKLTTLVTLLMTDGIAIASTALAMRALQHAVKNDKIIPTNTYVLNI